MTKSRRLVGLDLLPRRLQPHHAYLFSEHRDWAAAEMQLVNDPFGGALITTSHCAEKRTVVSIPVER